MTYSHIPVMLQETLEYLEPRLGQKFIDGTLGGAGYTLALAEAVGNCGRIIAVDQDTLAIENAVQIIKQQGLSNIVLVQNNFKNLNENKNKVDLCEVTYFKDQSKKK